MQQTDETTPAELEEFLKGFPAPMIAEILAKRKDLDKCVLPGGMVEGPIWSIRATLGAVACVDGVAVRLNDKGEVEGGVIRRRTGQFPDKLAYIGGVVGRYESIEAAMRRHWRTDLGLKIELPLGWSHPVCMRQYAPQVDGKNREGFCWDPKKHSYASTHLVVITSDPKNITLGSTAYGGQEASGFEWYTGKNCPPDSEWSYDMRDGFLEVLAVAKSRSADLFS